MNKCDCWHEESYWDGWETNIMGRDEPRIKTKCVCWGTKEKDECDCGGDRTKCDFYPEVRKKAEAEEKQITIKEFAKIIIYEIMLQWGCDPAYYWKSSDSVERVLAKHDSELIEFIENKVKEYCG